MVPCHQRGGMPKSEPYVAPDVYDPSNHSEGIKANGAETTSSLSIELPLARKGPMNGVATTTPQANVVHGGPDPAAV